MNILRTILMCAVLASVASVGLADNQAFPAEWDELKMSDLARMSATSPVDRKLLGAYIVHRYQNVSAAAEVDFTEHTDFSTARGYWEAVMGRVVYQLTGVWEAEKLAKLTIATILPRRQDP